MASVERIFSYFSLIVFILFFNFEVAYGMPNLGNLHSWGGSVWYSDALSGKRAFVTPRKIELARRLDGTPDIFVTKFRLLDPDTETGYYGLQGGHLSGKIHIIWGSGPNEAVPVSIIWSAVGVCTSSNRLEVREIIPQGKNLIPFSVPLTPNETDFIISSFKAGTVPPFCITVWIVYSGLILVNEQQFIPVSPLAIHDAIKAVSTGKDYLLLIPGFEDRLTDLLLGNTQSGMKLSTVGTKGLFGTIRRDFLRYYWPSGICCENGHVRAIMQGIPTDDMVYIHLGGWMYAEELRKYDIDWTFTLENPEQHIENTVLMPQGTPMTEEVQFSLALEPAKMNIDFVMIRVEYRESDHDYIRKEVIRLDKDKMKSIWRFQMRYPFKAILEYNLTVVTQDGHILDTNTPIRISNPPFSFSIPVHFVSLRETIMKMLKDKEK